MKKLKRPTTKPTPDPLLAEILATIDKKRVNQRFPKDRAFQMAEAVLGPIPSRNRDRWVAALRKSRPEMVGKHGLTWGECIAIWIFAVIRSEQPNARICGSKVQEFIDRFGTDYIYQRATLSYNNQAVFGKDLPEAVYKLTGQRRHLDTFRNNIPDFSAKTKYRPIDILPYLGLNPKVA